MDSNDDPERRSPEQDEAPDEVEPGADDSQGLHAPADPDLAEGGEPMADPGAERPRTPQAGL
jgi:hypothetical protein